MEKDLSVTNLIMTNSKITKNYLSLVNLIVANKPYKKISKLSVSSFKVFQWG
jgi:hypothetical protein